MGTLTVNVGDVITISGSTTLMNYVDFNGTALANQGSYSFTVTSGGSMTFYSQDHAAGSETFTLEIVLNASTTYTISTSSSPSNGGSTSGGGTFDAGTSQTVTATANPDFTFVNWTEEGNEVSTNASYSFTLDRDRDLVANFQVVTYPLTVNSGSGSGNYTAGSVVTISAGTPPAGQQFKNWTSSPSVSFADASSPTTSFTMPSEAVTATANFEAIPIPPSLEVSTPNLNFSSDETGSQSVTIVSNVNWTADSDQTWATVSPTSGSNDGSINVAVTANSSTASRTATVTVKGGGFMKFISVDQEGATPIVNAQTPTISTQPQDATVDVGTTVTLSVSASVTDGGTVSYQWYAGSSAISGATSSSYSPSTAIAGAIPYYVVITNTNNNVNGTKTAIATSNVATVVVNEAMIFYTVTFDAEGGSPIPPPQTVESGSLVTEPATPEKTDFIFAGWYNGEVKWNFATDVVSSDLTLIAKWSDDTAIESIDASKVIVYSQKGLLVVKSDDQPLQRVEIFNLSGQLLRAVQSGGGISVEISNLPQAQVLIVKVTMSNYELSISKRLLLNK